MSSRKTPLIAGEYYHVYNRSLLGVPIFAKSREADNFIKALVYYAQSNPLRRLSFEKRCKENKINYDNRLVSIAAYCLMPNHFHLLLKQETDKGISRYMQKLTLSFVRYYNTLHRSKGPIFESKFKSVLIESEYQLLHVSRYIHLNPSSAGLVDDPLVYKYSSFCMYVNGGENKPLVFDDVLRTRKRGYYEKFVYDNVEYQRTLEFIKHHLVDDET